MLPVVLPSVALILMFLYEPMLPAYTAPDNTPVEVLNAAQ